jgi:hypothetical protein
VAIAVLISIFARYVDTDKFTGSAFFSIGMTYFFSLSSIGLLAIDLSFTLYNEKIGDKEA